MYLFLQHNILKIVLSAITAITAFLLMIFPVAGKKTGQLAFDQHQAGAGKMGYGLIGENQDDDVQNFGIISNKNNQADSLFRERIAKFFPGQEFRMIRFSVLFCARFKSGGIYAESPWWTEVKGFNGSVQTSMFVRSDGTIGFVKLLKSDETPSYLNKIESGGFFSQFEEMELNREHHINAVSGATITSKAIAKSASELVNLYKDVLPAGNSLKKTFKVEAKLNKVWILNVSLLIILFLILKMKRFRRKYIITTIALFTLVWLGFYLNSSFTYLLIFKSFTTSISIFTTVYILLVIFSAIWDKNLYCKFICPFGNAQKIVRFLPLKTKIVKLNNRQLKRIRYIITIVVVSAYFSGLKVAGEYELFPWFFGVNASYIIFVISLVAILISLVVPQLWCRALCPTGCTLDLISDFANLKTLQLKVRKNEH